MSTITKLQLKIHLLGYAWLNRNIQFNNYCLLPLDAIAYLQQRL